MTKRHIVLLGIVIIVSGLLLVLAAAQDNSTLNHQLVFVSQGDIATANGDGNDIEVIAEGQRFDPLNYQPNQATYHMPVISSDHQTVYFANWFEDALLTVPLDGADDVQIFSETALYQPLGMTISPDGLLLGVAAQTQDGLVFVYLDNSGTLLRVVPFAFKGGCGSGPALPEDQLYTMQTGTLGNPLLMEWVEAERLLVSAGCDSVGIEVIDLGSGEQSTLHQSIQRPKISLEGDYIAGFIEDTLVIIDAKTGETLEQSTDLADYDQVGWANDGQLLFTTVNQVDEIEVHAKDLALRNEVFFDQHPATVPQYQVDLYRWHINEDELPELLWSTDALRGIPVIVAADDTVFFSGIENSLALVEALNAGKSRSQVLDAWPKSNIYSVSLYGGEVNLIIENGESPTLIWN